MAQIREKEETLYTTPLEESARLCARNKGFDRLATQVECQDFLL